MRGPLVLAALLLLAAPASAQLGATLTLQVDAPDAPVGAEGGKVVATLAMVCQTQSYMPDTIVELDVQGPAGSRIDGPESVFFAGHLCLSDPYPEQAAEFTIHLPSDINASQTVSYHLEAFPRNVQHPFYVSGADADFQLQSPPAPAAPPAAEPEVQDDGLQDAIDTAAEEAAKHDEDVATVPGLGWLAPLLGLAGAAMLRRRT